MDLIRVSSQKNKLSAFESFLRKDIALLIRTKPSVKKAMMKYGLLDFVPDFHHNGTLPDSQAKRDAIITKMLTWGTAPTFMVMNDTGDAFGIYMPGVQNIRIYKDLVETWEGNQKDKVLCRGLMATVIHEMVHYLNDVILPSNSMHTGPNHLRKNFHHEAFGPLSWDRGHYQVLAPVLKLKGVTPPS